MRLSNSTLLAIELDNITGSQSKNYLCEKSLVSRFNSSTYTLPHFFKKPHPRRFWAKQKDTREFQQPHKFLVT